MSTAAPSPGIPAFHKGDRMRKSMQAAGLSYSDMMEYLDVSRNTISAWINLRTSPSRQTMRLWALRTGVPLEWLETGAVTSDEGENREVVRHQGFEPRARWIRTRPRSGASSVPAA